MKVRKPRFSIVRVFSINCNLVAHRLQTEAELWCNGIRVYSFYKFHLANQFAIERGDKIKQFLERLQVSMVKRLILKSCFT